MMRWIGGLVLLVLSGLVWPVPLHAQSPIPTASPAGPLVGAPRLHVRQERTPAMAVLSPVDGSQRMVVDDDRFGAMASPRFAPDGAWIAFTATLGPPDRELRPLSREAWPAAERVAAHNAPWD